MAALSDRDEHRNHSLKGLTLAIRKKNASRIEPQIRQSVTNQFAYYENSWPMNTCSQSIRLMPFTVRFVASMPTKTGLGPEALNR
jgi:hypothetical protein